MEAAKTTVDAMAACEVSFQRLLKQCKLLARDEVVQKQQLWRLDRYVQRLEKLFDVVSVESSVNPETVAQYRSELDFLKMLVKAEQKGSNEAKLKAIEHIPETYAGDQPTSSRADGAMTTAGFSNSNVTTRQVKRATKAQHQAELRSELMASSRSADGSGIRLGAVADRFDVSENADLDTVLKHHHQMQQQMADQLLRLTTDFKENVTVAGRVISDDNKTLETVTRRATSNEERLSTESRRLERHARASLFSCGVYLVLLLVVLVFIGMVLFMRLFRKPRYDAYAAPPTTTTAFPPPFDGAVNGEL